MNGSTVNLITLCDEILIIIFNKLNNNDVLYSFIGVNRKLDQLVQDITFTKSVDLTTISSNKDNNSNNKSTIDRFCFDILPRIQHKIECLTLDQLLIDRVLDIGNYPKLHKITLVNLTFAMAFRIFLDDSPFLNLFKHQISNLVVTINDKKKEVFIQKCCTYIFVEICNMFTNLTHLNFDLKDGRLHPSAVLHESLAKTCYSKSITHLNVKIDNFDDCLCLLNGRFSQLRTFIVEVNRIYKTSTVINNTETVSNLKYFSLTLFWRTSRYDSQILPLLRQMLQLEKLTLSLLVRGRTSFIDGTHLDNEIISQMPYLQTFIFDIVTEYIRMDEELLPTSDDVRYTLVQKGYNVGCYTDYLFEATGRCHIYSLPFSLERMQDITINFSGIVFTHVRQLRVHDYFRSIEHDFFVLISQAFPLLEHLTVLSCMEQKKKQSNKLDEHKQPFLVVEYSRLMTLDLSAAHIDYVKQFLLDSNTRLPCLNTLKIDYEQLANVTVDFTSDTAHANCEKLTKIIFFKRPTVIGTNFFNYFPFVRDLFSS